VLEHKSDVSRWENDSITLAKIREKFNNTKYFNDSMFAQCLYDIALTAVPALPLSAAQFLFPLIIVAFFKDTGLFGDYNLETFATSFPSDNTMRKHIVNQAARDTISLGNKLKDAKIHMASDKGNKKGIGHFVKMLSNWNREGGVSLSLLDIDASGGSSKECAAAIQSSMNKLKLEDNANAHLLSGQNTDNGGGGTIKNLYKHLQPLNICVPEEDYLIGNCTIHSLQIQLNNAIKNTFGEGGLDKVNAMQMIHSVCRLQESVDKDEWRHILGKSCQFANECDVEDTTMEIVPVAAVAPEPAETSAVTTTKKKKKKVTKTNALLQHEAKAEFLVAFRNVCGYHDGFVKDEVDPTTRKFKGTILAKMTAPMSTRWWTVGSGASFLFSYFLQIYHGCQTIVNVYPSGSIPNDIASSLFAFMTDQANFVDLTLIRGFDKAYLNPHLDWLQASVDLTGIPGFQAHHVTIR